MAGQPTKYSPKFIEKLIKYFSVKPYARKNGALEASDFPTLAGFAIQLGVHRDTLHEWSKQHPDFKRVYDRAKDFQENYLVTNGLKGLVNPSLAIFALKNVNHWRDKQPGEEDKINIKITLADRMAKARARVKKGDSGGET